MRARHLGHRSLIRSGADGLGRHFLEQQGQGLNLKNSDIFEESVMRYFSLTIVASVERGKPWTQDKLDQLEGILQKNLMTMDYNGGLNIRDKVRRRRKLGIEYLHCSIFLKLFLFGTERNLNIRISS
jgi:hypothetical protein